MRVLIIFNLSILLTVLITVVNGNSPNKIFGGNFVDINQYAFQVSVQIRNYHICGGAIISIYHIMTAASCALHSKNVFYGNIKIISGTTDLEALTSYSKIHQVAYIIFHSQYDPRNNWVNDIAIFKVDKPMDFHYLCRPIAVSTEPPKDNKFTAIGWGIDPVTSIMSRLLQSLKVRSLHRPSCRQIYTHPAYHFLQSSQHCLLPLLPTSRLTMVIIN
ncbi:prostasin-like [Aphidius gifuensis]|uniref:prostasin-like n=1 Tax=Aphidius gifuensis TaxID=684658 RepID=UPI001CDBF82E|nr:prostasin-like [Aphidius gifuensis]